MAEVTPVFMDCDPGHDDAIALLLLCNDPSIRVIGVTAVAGNQTVDKTYANALKLTAIAGRADLPVYRGQAAPILRAPKHDPGIHGDSGLDGSPTFDAFARGDPVPVEWAEKKGVVAMAEAIANDPAEHVTIIATGALTNVALLLTLFPELKPKIERIVFMGGAMGIGNRHPVAEFNIVCDPEAAKVVVDSGLEVVMVPLEVTHTAIFTGDIQHRIEALGGKLSKMVVELMTFFSATYKTEFGFQDGPPVHDACAVAYVINPSLFVAPLMRVDVITGEHICAGQTVCDQYNSFQGKAPNVKVAMKMDVDALGAPRRLHSTMSRDTAEVIEQIRIYIIYREMPFYKCENS